MKRQKGKDIWLYGGAELNRNFIRWELIDINRISVHPVALGRGKPLFLGLQERLNLHLMEAKTFTSGVVQWIYHS